MKITKTKLKQVIKEEVVKLLVEQDEYDNYDDYDEEEARKLKLKIRDSLEYYKSMIDVDSNNYNLPLITSEDTLQDIQGDLAQWKSIAESLPYLKDAYNSAIQELIDFIQKTKDSMLHTAINNPDPESFFKEIDNLNPNDKRAYQRLYLGGYFISNQDSIQRLIDTLKEQQLQ